MANSTTKNNNITKVVSQLVGVLNTRSKDVISRRFGLKTGRKETLDSIGKGYGITRERVRQIEAVALKQMRSSLSSGFNKAIEPYVNLATSILEEYGGTMRDNHFYEQYFGTIKDKNSIAALTLLLTLNSNPLNVQEDDDLHSHWTLSDDSSQKAASLVNTLESLLEKNQQPVHDAELVSVYKKAYPSNTDPKAFWSCVNLSKNIGKNIFNEFGLVSWPNIKPRGVKDRAYLVVKRNSKPQHFRDITKMINLANFSDKKANVQTVHNELIKDNRFVLVGRGTYALTEWGFKAGTVKDVLVDLLKSAKKPLDKAELISQVLDHRMVKENTILLNLQDSKTFKKTDNGSYSLREA